MVTVAYASVDERTKFIQRSYTHLAGAIGAFIIVEFLFFQIGIARIIAEFVFATRFAWLAILGGMSLLGWLSRELISQNNVTFLLCCANFIKNPVSSLKS